MSSGVRTFVFTDLVGSASLTSRLGDEAADVVRRMHFSLLRDAVAATGGREVKNLGDGLMVTFSDAADALDCAAAMQQATHRHNARPGAEPLGLRVGAHVGPAIPDGADFFGITVTAAKRLCDRAASGQVLVSDDVRELAGARTQHELRSLGSIELKGLRAPLPSCEVCWRPVIPAPLALPPGLVAGRPAALVDRKRELEQIEDALRGADDRRLVLLHGEPGVGKSRLVAEIGLRVHAGGTRVLLGHCDTDARLPYEPFVEALTHYVLACPLNDLRLDVGSAGRELRRIVPELVLRLQDMPEPLTGDPAGERHRLFDAVARVLTAAAPLVLVLEDLQWADAVTVLLLEHLVRTTADSRLVFLATCRSGEEPALDVSSEQVCRVTLDGLPEADVAALLTDLIGESAPADLASAVHERTAGNPLFVREAVRHVGTGRWRRGAEAVLDLPPRVHDALVLRIEALDSPTRAVLTRAAAVGLAFDPALVGSPEETTPALLRASDEELVAPVPAAPGRYAFVHAVVRDSLYAAIPDDRRPALHREIALALEQRCGGEPGPHLGDLAYHFLQAAPAGELDAALDYAGRAARQAQEQAAYERAAAHLAAAVAALDAHGAPDDPRELELLLALGDAQRLAGEPGVARATFLRVADAARERGADRELVRAAQGLTAWTHAYALRAQSDEVGAGLLEEALARLEDDELALRATLLSQLAFAQYFDRGRDALGPGGERRCSRSAREALRIARDAGDSSALAAALHAQMYSVAGLDARGALELSAEMVELGRLHDDWELILWARSWRVLHHLMLCDTGAMDVEVRAFTELTEELKVPVYQWFIARWRALRALLAGRLEEGERLAMQAFEIGQAAQHGEAAALHLGGQLAVAREFQGRQLELLPPVEAAVSQYPTLVGWRCALAALCATYGRHDEAREHLDLLARDDFAVLPRDWDWLVAMRALTLACCALEDAPRCDVLREQLQPFADVSMCSGWATMCCGPVATCLGMLATVVERWDEAEHHFEDALRLAAGLASPPFIAQVQVAYAGMLLRKGTRGRGLELAARALTAADSMGMVELADQAHTLLAPRRHTVVGPDG